MTLFLDASAIVAMIAREPEASTFAEIVEHYELRFTSPIAVWEAARAVARVRRVDFAEARTIVAAFILDAKLQIVAIDAATGELAMDAHQRYGKGMDPATLNMGDCFAHAVTKQLEADILFKGEDFILTDLTDATLP